MPATLRLKGLFKQLKTKGFEPSKAHRGRGKLRAASLGTAIDSAAGIGLFTRSEIGAAVTIVLEHG